MGAAIMQMLLGQRPQQASGPMNPVTPMDLMKTGAAKPRPTATPDPFSAATSSVQQRFPRLKNVPLNVTTGSGPYESEVYQPWQEDNPAKGKFTVQLRSDQAKSQRGRMLEDSIAAESFHHLGTLKPDGTPVDPEWWNLKQQFRQTLTPGDLKLAKQHWQEEQKSGEKRSFDDFLNHNYLDMFVRGYIFPESQGQEWVDRKGKWNPKQAAVLEKMKQLLQSQQ